MAFHVDGCISRYQLNVGSDAAVAGFRVVVDQYEERNLLVGDERGRVAAITGTDGDDARTEVGDVVVGTPQLRGMFAAVQSAEVAEEHEHDALIRPEVAQAVRHAVGVDEGHRGESLQIHRAA